MLYKNCGREVGLCCREGLSRSGALDGDWSKYRTGMVWESRAGRRCLDSPLQSCDLYHGCFAKL